MKLNNKKKEALAGLLFVSPWIIGFIIFGAFPIIYSLYLSFNDVTSTAFGIATEYVGLENYQVAFTTDLTMVNRLIEFLKDKILMVFIINVFAVLFAVLLNGKIKGRGFFRTIFFLPVVIVSGPVMAELVNKNVITMPSIGNFGVISLMGTVFGSSIQEFIVKTFSNLIYMFWFSGVQLIVYLTVLQRMDKSMYEAAEIDGASVWESFWKVTLPALKTAILINIVYTLILLATFDDNPVIRVILDTMKNKGYGRASALSWIYFITLAIIIFIVFIIFYGRIKKSKRIDCSVEGFCQNKLRYIKQDNFFNSTIKGKKIKRKILGKNFSDGILAKVFVYTILTVMSFAFLYPFIYMLLKSIQSPDDVLNPTVGLLPTTIYLRNLGEAYRILGFWKSLWTSTYCSLLPTIFQVASCSVIGYGLAKFKFPCKKLIFILVVLSFVIPPQILMIPTYVMYSKLGFLNSILTFIIPASLGQGIRSTIFILLFYQSFSMIPKQLEEAAQIDGASRIKVFFKVAIPLSIPMFIVAFIFSFVWYWNETYLTSLYMEEVTTLPMKLSQFADSFRALHESTGSQVNQYQDKLNEAIYMAGTLISIIPLLIIYFVLQKWFVQGIDQTGLTGQ